MANNGQNKRSGIHFTCPIACTDQQCDHDDQSSWCVDHALAGSWIQVNVWSEVTNARVTRCNKAL